MRFCVLLILLVQSFLHSLVSSFPVRPPFTVSTARSSDSPQTFTGSKLKMAESESETHVENVLFIECGEFYRKTYMLRRGVSDVNSHSAVLAWLSGFGNDSHGQNATKAAGNQPTQKFMPLISRVLFSHTFPIGLFAMRSSGLSECDRIQFDPLCQQSCPGRIRRVEAGCSTCSTTKV